MEGRISYIDNSKGYGYIKTENKEIGDLSFYFEANSCTMSKDDTVSFEITTSKKTGKKYAKNVKSVVRNASKYNTEDKQKWCKEGEQLEKAFVENIVPKLSIKLDINPQKKTNPYAIDLIDYTNKKYADLKSQNTPFFTAGRYKYGKEKEIQYDAQFTVTFNKKDYENYKKNYPNCDIYWCINWTQLTYGSNTIKPLDGVWVAKFSDMANKIEQNEVYLHEYIHRKDDDVNAKDSYLFDLSDETVFKKLI